MFVLRRLSAAALAPDEDGPSPPSFPDAGAGSSMGLSLCSLPGADICRSPSDGAWREQKPSQPSAAREAQNRRLRGMYRAHPPGLRVDSASAISARFSCWYISSHSGSLAMISLLLLIPVVAS